MNYDTIPYHDCQYLMNAFQARLKEADEVNEIAYLKHGVKECMKRLNKGPIEGSR